MNAHILALSLAAATSTYAATIVWTAESATTGGQYTGTLATGAFDSSGLQFLAENVGGNAITFDGINFDAGTTVFTGTFSRFALDQLGGTGTYGNSSANTVSLSGLAIGTTYRIQALVWDGRGDTGIPGRTVSFDGLNQGTYANGTANLDYGTALLVTGAFTADTTTQNFTIETFDGSTSKGGQLNALTVFATGQAVPEPSSAALLPPHLPHLHANQGAATALGLAHLPRRGALHRRS